MNKLQITSHSLWIPALKCHRQGVVACDSKERKSRLNESFDNILTISKDLQIPVYDIMMLVRDRS